MRFLIFEDHENEVFVINERAVTAVKINIDQTDTIWAQGGVTFEGNLLGSCEHLSEAMNAAYHFADPKKVEN